MDSDDSVSHTVPINEDYALPQPTHLVSCSGYILRDKFGHTALDYATECGLDECSEIIRDVSTQRG